MKPFLRGNSGALCYALFERCLSPLRTSDTTTTKNRAAARYREEPSERIRIKVDIGRLIIPTKRPDRDRHHDHHNYYIAVFSADFPFAIPHRTTVPTRELTFLLRSPILKSIIKWPSAI